MRLIKSNKTSCASPELLSTKETPPSEKHCTDTAEERKIHHGRISWKELTPLITQMAHYLRGRDGGEWGMETARYMDGEMAWDVEERKERVLRRRGNRAKEDERGMRFLFLSRTFITSRSLFWWSLCLCFSESVSLSSLLTAVKGELQWFPTLMPLC